MCIRDSRDAVGSDVADDVEHLLHQQRRQAQRLSLIHILTHNLRDVRMPQNAPATPYVPAFQDWYARHLATHDVPALLDWQARAPGARQAHPHDDHLMPLYVALGAGGEQATRCLLYTSRCV